MQCHVKKTPRNSTAASAAFSFFKTSYSSPSSSAASSSPQLRRSRSNLPRVVKPFNFVSSLSIQGRTRTLRSSSITALSSSISAPQFGHSSSAYSSSSSGRLHFLFLVNAAFRFVQPVPDFIYRIKVSFCVSSASSTETAISSITSMISFSNFPSLVSSFILRPSATPHQITDSF